MSRAHDDVEARCLGDSLQRQGVSADGNIGRVNDRAAPQRGEFAQLLYGQVDIVMEHVVEQ